MERRGTWNEGTELNFDRRRGTRLSLIGYNREDGIQVIGWFNTVKIGNADFIGNQRCLIDPGRWEGGSQAGRQPNFGGLVLGCIDTDFCK